MHTIDGHGNTVLSGSALRQLLITVEISPDYLRYQRGPEAEAGGKHVVDRKKNYNPS